MTTLVVVVIVGLAAHVATTVIVGKWLANIARQEIREGLVEIRDLLPPHVRAMLGIDQREDISV